MVDNWLRELRTWCPALEVLLYYGSQEERRGIRSDLLDGNMDNFQILLTTSVTIVDFFVVVLYDKKKVMVRFTYIVPLCVVRRCCVSQTASVQPRPQPKCTFMDFDMQPYSCM